MEQFEMEELIPLLTELTEKYTSFDSTSVTYETARQLMGAVLYCINEAETAEDFSESRDNWAADNAEVLTVEKPSARILYDRGRILVLDKVQAAKRLYEELLTEFQTYGVLCYKETILDGIPEFFKNYDVRYNPQEHLLTLDYPVMGGYGRLCGVDLIYSYLERVALEQRFLCNVPKEFVQQVLTHKYGLYRELFINPCQETLRSLILRLFVRELEEEDGGAKVCGGESNDARYAAVLEKSILEGKLQKLNGRITEKIHILSAGFGDRSERMEQYLLLDSADFSTELMTASELGRLGLFVAPSFAVTLKR